MFIVESVILWSLSGLTAVCCCRHTRVWLQFFSFYHNLHGLTSQCVFYVELKVKASASLLQVDLVRSGVGFFCQYYIAVLNLDGWMF